MLGISIEISTPLSELPCSGDRGSGRRSGFTLPTRETRRESRALPLTTRMFWEGPTLVVRIPRPLNQRLMPSVPGSTSCEPGYPGARSIVLIGAGRGALVHHDGVAERLQVQHSRPAHPQRFQPR
jgi:hypothetical protein